MLFFRIAISGFTIIMEGETMQSSRSASYVKSLPFWLLGFALAALTTLYSLSNINGTPVILKTPASAAQCTDALMERIALGEFTDASQYLYAAPDLGLAEEPEDTVGKLIWDAWQDSISYEFTSACYATGSGLARDLRFSCLDVDAVTESLAPIAQEIFHTRLDTTEDQNLIYNAQNNYREDFIQSVIDEAVKRALKENTTLQESNISLQLAYDRGRWLVVADNTFLNTVFGEVIG
jgi:hypothetical protein